MDLIIEVSHPDTMKNYAKLLLCKGDIFIGSPTALADLETETQVRKFAKEYQKRVYISVEIVR